MRLEHPSRGYIEISISSWHQIRLAAQEVSAFQNSDELSRVLADCRLSEFLRINDRAKSCNVTQSSTHTKRRMKHSENYILQLNGNIFVGLRRSLFY